MIARRALFLALLPVLANACSAPATTGPNPPGTASGSTPTDAPTDPGSPAISGSPTEGAAPTTPAAPSTPASPGSGGLVAVSGFANPGALGMYEYVPPGVLSGALVVALHGCTQSASVYDKAGWSSAAAVYGMVVLYPEQASANNLNRCFNWYCSDDTLRNGEALSIANAIQKTIDAHGLDAQRVYVTGLSAGGAMTAVLLANYPDRGDSHTTFTGFAAGAVMAGLAFDAACTGTSHATCPTGSSYGDAFTAMNPGKSLAATDWGARVRDASPNAQRWPRVSIWGGTSDTTVAPTNVDALVAQWTDVHGLGTTATSSGTVDGATHAAFANASGDVLVESYRIPGMSHGVAIDPGHVFGGVAGKSCGQATAYVLSAGICSTEFALSFFGENGQVASTPTPSMTPPTPTGCTSVTASNTAHVQAGRAIDLAGFAYGKVSYQYLGKDDDATQSTVYSKDGNTWTALPCS